jgi:putative transposase
LAARAESWRWSSRWHRCHTTEIPWLSDWPLPLPKDWLNYVNQAETENELAALRRSVIRGAPYGDEQWQKETAEVLGLQSALRPPGRPKKAQKT